MVLESWSICKRFYIAIEMKTRDNAHLKKYSYQWYCNKSHFTFAFSAAGKNGTWWPGPGHESNRWRGRCQLIHIKDRIPYHRITRQNIKHTIKKTQSQTQSDTSKNERRRRNKKFHTIYYYIAVCAMWCAKRKSLNGDVPHHSRCVLPNKKLWICIFDFKN